MRGSKGDKALKLDTEDDERELRREYDDANGAIVMGEPTVGLVEIVAVEEGKGWGGQTGLLWDEAAIMRAAVAMAELGEEAVDGVAAEEAVAREVGVGDAGMTTRDWRRRAQKMDFGYCGRQRERRRKKLDRRSWALGDGDNQSGVEATAHRADGMDMTVGKNTTGSKAEEMSMSRKEQTKSRGRRGGEDEKQM